MDPRNGPILLPEPPRKTSVRSRNWFNNIRPGDVNLDGIVNSQDLANVSSNWLRTGVGLLSGDVNGDGIVNSQDLATISSNWLQTGGAALEFWIVQRRVGARADVFACFANRNRCRTVRTAPTRSLVDSSESSSRSIVQARFYFYRHCGADQCVSHLSAIVSRIAKIIAHGPRGDRSTRQR